MTLDAPSTAKTLNSRTSSTQEVLNRSKKAGRSNSSVRRLVTASRGTLARRQKQPGRSEGSVCCSLVVQPTTPPFRRITATSGTSLPQRRHDITRALVDCRQVRTLIRSPTFKVNRQIEVISAVGLTGPAALRRCRAFGTSAATGGRGLFDHDRLTLSWRHTVSSFRSQALARPPVC